MYVLACKFFYLILNLIANFYLPSFILSLVHNYFYFFLFSDGPVHSRRAVTGALPTLVSVKEGENTHHGKGRNTQEYKEEPIVAFSKPPWPPLLVPVVALSILDVLSNSDEE